MTTTNDGRPAFPCQELGEDGSPMQQLCEGLTKREWFAGMALQGLYANSGSAIINNMSCTSADKIRKSLSEIADLVLAQADSMIERSGK